MTRKTHVLLNEFRFSSPVFRHALRASVAITLAIASAKALGLAHSVWVPVSVLVIMRPSLGGTLHISLRRLVGTAAGALAGAGLAWLNLPVPWVTVIVMVLAFFVFYFKAHNYLLFTAVLTIVLVLIVGTVFSHAWQGGAERMFDTLLGISIGLAASFLVWPNFARKNLRQEMAGLIRAQHDHFRQLRQAYFCDRPDEADLLSGRLKARTLLDACTAKFTDAAIEPGLRSAQRQELVNLADVFARIHRTLISLSSVVSRSTGVFHGSIRSEFENLMDRVDEAFSRLEDYAATGTCKLAEQEFNAGFSRFMVFLGRMRSQGQFENFTLDSRNNASAFIREIHRLGTELERAVTRIKTLRQAK